MEGVSSLTEERLKIAVFIDFDNIEIGVKKTLARYFDVGNVLEAIKERGEVVSKIAYGDWKRAEDYSRAMTQHAVHMVQRNLTPGGDKNGADITLALDALEMAFTRTHINAFVIVGGDSDFIALVEKLKQYDKTVFVVGGREFTSVILQKNCHEFIAYENLISSQSGSRKASGKPAPSGRQPLQSAFAPIRRALEILADREVSPQLGLLKSTLLQLDSTFSERDYGARSFREFMQKIAGTGFVKLRHADRNMLVELDEAESEAEPSAQASEPQGRAQGAKELPADRGSASEVLAAIRNLLESSGKIPPWPMYLRNFRQFLKSADPRFTEKAAGYVDNILELAKMAQKEGLLRMERNRQGAIRLYPGDRLGRGLLPKSAEEAPAEAAAPAEGAGEPAAAAMPPAETESVIAGPETAVPESVPEKPKRKRRAAPKKTARKPAKKAAARRPRQARKKTADG